MSELTRMTRENTLRLLGLGGLACLGVAVMGGLGGYRINTTPSYPIGLWRVLPLHRSVERGDRIFICPPNDQTFRLAKSRGYLRNGLCAGGFGPLIKTVAATSGQSIRVDGSITIDGVPLRSSEVRSVDGQGRMMTAFAGGIVPAGYLFLHSDFGASFDSRYFGPVPDVGILGLAREVLTYEP